MATQCSSANSQQEQHTPDYDYVDQPDRDYFCPVSLELLTQPQQTICCGHHISQQAADRLIRERKPCPMCNKDNFAAHEDLYFTRKVRQLKVYCSYKKSGCKWIGELGSLNQHTTSCAKRPWKCPYCSFQSTHQTGTADHTPKCDYQPVPCPNKCDIGTIPRCLVKEHQGTCPLQLVHCEVAGIGCDVMVPRKDLAGHMTENVQDHLMRAIFLNLQKTQDLYQIIEEKDKHIVKLQTKLQQQVDAKFQEISSKVDKKFQEISTKLEQLQGAQSTSKPPDEAAQLISRGFICHEDTLYGFTQCQSTADGKWTSRFSVRIPTMYPFVLRVFTKGRNGRGIYLSVSLLKRHDNHKTEGAAVLQLLNQLEDNNHFTGNEMSIPRNDHLTLFGEKFFPLANLGYNATNNTQYLKDNCLKFRVFLKVYE